MTDGPDLETDALLGRLAIQRGWITEEILQQAFAQRDQELAAGRGQPRAIGNLLVARGSLTDSQLIQLLDELRLRRSGKSIPAILGKYHIRRELGRGGMGVVYEAEDVELKRSVALKLMLLSGPDTSDDLRREEEERFLRESRLCAGLPRHPGIVGVYEAGVIEGKRYLAMEFIRGCSMNEWRKGASLTVPRQIDLLRHVLLAVHHAHQNGIVHRDLKPQNILVDAEGRPHVVDFGLAKAFHGEDRMTLTASGVVVGTPAYMSPEQARGVKKIDRKTDIWAVGVMLFELLAGRLPYTGDSPIDLLVRVAKDPTPLPVRTGMRGARSDRDRILEEICLKALAKNPVERYGTAQAFADDLHRWINGESVHIDRPGRSKPGNLRLRVAVGAAALGLLGALYLAWPTSIPTEPSPQPPKIARPPIPPPPREVLPDPPGKPLPEALPAKIPAPTVPEPAVEKAVPAVEPPKPLPTEPARPLPDPAPPVLPPPNAPAESDPWKNAVNLLALLDPAKDKVSGLWTLDGKGLHSDPTEFAAIEIPYVPPQEYDFRIRFVPQGSVPDVNQVLSQDGRPFQWFLGAYSNTTLGFGLHKGVASQNAPTLVKRAKVLTSGQAHTSIVQVRKDGVTGFLDGVKVITWADTSLLKLDARLMMSADVRLGLTSYRCATQFQAMEILEITGRGRPLRGALPPSDTVNLVLDVEKKISMDFVPIAPGKFTRGQGKEAQEVTLTRPFWIQTTETTQVQWEALMKSNPSFNKAPDLPVEMVSWTDAQKFIAELARKSGDRKPGLPTEAEWEYACRAGATSRWSWGEQPGDGGDHGWFSINSGGRTRPVGRKLPNAWGLFDMHGNVREWCQDLFAPYGAAARDPVGPATGKSRVIRGGGCLLDPRFASLDTRENMEPGWKERFLGFRVVLR